MYTRFFNLCVDGAVHVVLLFIKSHMHVTVKMKVNLVKLTCGLI